MTYTSCGKRRVHGVGVAVLFVATAIGAAVPVFGQELAGPTDRDRQVSKVVVLLMSKGHLLQRALDDEVSRRTLKNYLKTLDPTKRYFLQSDIDSFNKWETELDDLTKAGNISPAFDMFKVFLKRLDERVKLVDQLVKEEYDFTTDEELYFDPDKAPYLKTEAEARDFWRKRIKFELLEAKTKGETLEEARQRLTRRYHSLAKRMRQTTSDEILEWYLTAVTTSYDPHSTYMSPSTLDDFMIQMKLQLDGIGAALSSEDGVTVVTKVIPGGAAAKDGRLKNKDRVIGVGQGPAGEIVDVADMKLNHVVKLIRGQRGTIVRLNVLPAGESKPKIIDLTRATIELDDSAARSDIIEDGKKPNGQPYRVGVIDLPSFYMDMSGSRDDSDDYRSTTRDVRKILDKFKEKEVDAVIMDLRRNGGGSLIEAIHLTGLFIDQGPVVQVKDIDGKVEAYDDKEAGTAWSGPLVVLTSKFSASASEIFAGAIQDYRRGLIVGDPATHGKGTVQTLLNLGQKLFHGPKPPNLGALKMTMQQFYRPNGESTQKRGVLADVTLPSITSHLDVAEADLDYSLAFDKVPAAAYKGVNLVDRGVVEQLNVLSKERRAKSEDFKKVEDRIAVYERQKKRKTFTLNEQKYKTEREELSGDKDPEKQIEKFDDPNRPAVERDYYFNEALAVTLDYIRLYKLAVK